VPRAGHYHRRVENALELGHVTERRPPYKYAAFARVWFSDTDAQGVVYYGRYLPYFDHARTEYHRRLGGLGGLARAEFVMRASHVDYLAPARFDDLIEAFVRVSRIGRTSITYGFSAWRQPDDILLVQSTQTLVLVDSVERRPVPIPEVLRAPIRAFEGTDLEE
jgi:acyl-CoA thioester hydrolase